MLINLNMKKLLLYLAIFTSFAAQAQHAGYVKRNTRDQVLATAADSTAHMPAGSVLSLGGGWNGAGAYRFNTTDSAEYLWTGTQWIRASQELFNHIVSGFDVSWNNGLVYDVAPGVAYVNGKRITYAGGQVTLTTADPSNPRIDIIVVQDDGTVIAVAGDPSANPVKPQAEANQLELTLATLDAGASTPNGVASTVLWDGEGADLVTGTTTGSVTFNNTVQAQHGTHSTFVAVGGLAGNQAITYKGTPVYNIGNYNHVKLYIRLGTALAGNRSPDFSFLNGNTVVSNVRPMTDFGLNRALINQWQTIIIPLSGFNYSNTNITGLRIARFNNTIGNFWVDNIQLESAPVINVSGAYLPLVFPSNQTVNGNGNSLAFTNIKDFTIVATNGSQVNEVTIDGTGIQYQSTNNNASSYQGLTSSQFITEFISNSPLGDVRWLLSTDSVSLFNIETIGNVYLRMNYYIHGLPDTTTLTKALVMDPTTGQIFTQAAGGGGGGGWPLTGSFLLAGDVAGDLAGHGFQLFDVNTSLNLSNGSFQINSDDLSTERTVISNTTSYARLLWSNEAETELNKIEVSTDGVLITLSAGKTFVIDGIAEFADNAAAISGGLTTGAFYRTADALKIVH